jgi:carbon-monoxide dehydrogenase large subunit
MKIFLHPEQPLVVWASRKLKRAVRWTGDAGLRERRAGPRQLPVAEFALDATGISSRCA